MWSDHAPFFAHDHGVWLIKSKFLHYSTTMGRKLDRKRGARQRPHMNHPVPQGHQLSERFPCTSWFTCKFYLFLTIISNTCWGTLSTGAWLSEGDSELEKSITKWWPESSFNTISFSFFFSPNLTFLLQANSNSGTLQHYVTLSHFWPPVAPKEVFIIAQQRTGSWTRRQRRHINPQGHEFSVRCRLAIEILQPIRTINTQNSQGHPVHSLKRSLYVAHATANLISCMGGATHPPNNHSHTRPRTQRQQ